MKKSRIILAIAAVATAVSVSAAEVKENYAKHCAKCHGEDGKGDTKMGKKVGIKDMTDAKVQAAFTDDKGLKSVKYGVKGDDGKTKMKAFGEDLSDDEIKALIAHMRTFKK